MYGWPLPTNSPFKFPSSFNQNPMVKPDRGGGPIQSALSFLPRALRWGSGAAGPLS